MNKPVFAITSNQGNNYVGGLFDSIDNMYSIKVQANYIAQFTFVVGGGINELSNNSDVNVFPNPNNGKFTFQVKGNTEKGKIEIYNVLGEKVLSQFNLQPSEFNIDLSNQPAGIYLYRLTTEKGELVGSGKLIIE